MYPSLDAAIYSSRQAKLEVDIPAYARRLMLLLHLSDLHFRRGEVGTAMDLNFHLRNELVRDAEAMCKRIGAPVDAVLISGDIAFQGHPDEYAFAVAWLETLCSRCGTSLSAVFL